MKTWQTRIKNQPRIGLSLIESKPVIITSLVKVDIQLKYNLNWPVILNLTSDGSNS